MKLTYNYFSNSWNQNLSEIEFIYVDFRNLLQIIKNCDCIRLRPTKSLPPFAGWIIPFLKMMKIIFISFKSRHCMKTKSYLPS